MSKVELKTLLLEKVMFEENEQKLLSWLQLMEDPDETIVKLTQDQRESIQRGLDDMAAGRYVTQEELEQEDQEWRRE